MTNDRRRGFKRLAIAVAVPWFVWWGFVGLFNYGPYIDARSSESSTWRDLTFVHDQASRAIALKAIAGYQTVEARAFEYMLLSLFCLIVVPILLLITYWVYRGFKPKRAVQTTA